MGLRNRTNEYGVQVNNHGAKDVISKIVTVIACITATILLVKDHLLFGIMYLVIILGCAAALVVLWKRRE